MRQQSRYFFSLMELMVVLAIIGVVSTVVGIRIAKSITDHNYASSSLQMVEKLKMAKQLALVNQTDVFVNFRQNKKDVICEIGFAPFSSASDVKYRHLFSNIHFRFEAEKKAAVDKAISFVFTQNGEMRPKGILFLSPSKKTFPLFEKKIDLKEMFSREIELENRKSYLSA